MALRECKECNAKISTSAENCPQCGAKQPKRTSVATWVICVIFGLVVFKVVSNSTSNFAEKSPPPSSAINSSSQTPLQTLAPLPNWIYSEIEDKMSGDKGQIAGTRSTNTLQFSFPYSAPDNRGTLLIRKNKSSGLNIYLAIDKGQFLCSYYDCSFRVKFDDNKPIDWNGAPPQNHDSTTIFLHNSKAFLERLKKSKKLMIEPKFYQSAGQILEFNVTDLQWP